MMLLTWKKKGTSIARKRLDPWIVVVVAVAARQVGSAPLREEVGALRQEEAELHHMNCVSASNHSQLATGEIIRTKNELEKPLEDRRMGRVRIV